MKLAERFLPGLRCVVTREGGQWQGKKNNLFPSFRHLDCKSTCDGIGKMNAIACGIGGSWYFPPHRGA